MTALALSPARTAWRALLHRLGQGLGRAVPAQCGVCLSFPAAPICAACEADLAPPRPRCARCALPVSAERGADRGTERGADQGAGHASPGGHPALAVCSTCQRHPPPLTHCLAALDYAFPWDQLIARFKFQGDAGLAGPLSALMARHSGLAGLAGWAGPCDGPAWLVPMPLHPRRLARRGFNPALELARGLRAVGAPPPRTDVLLRLRDTVEQRTLGREERLRNLAGAFACAPAALAGLRGRPVWLVDDVMTTGATLHEAARTLLAAGAGQVSAVVLARAGAPD